MKAISRRGIIITSESTEEADIANLPAEAERSREGAARKMASQSTLVFPPPFAELTVIAVFTICLCKVVV